MAKAGNVLLGLAAGLAVGVAVGVLFAPDKGEETRRNIKDGVSDKADKLKRKLEKLTQEVREKTGEVKENLEEKVENLLSKSSYKADDVITFLEKKLAALKEANAKLQK
ncbi:YtxH domain-containing protein [Capnocytophaga leadbetteri]|uniref:YtxH domain-containing protein n=1 Tax=Capnocytophaga leadbetteri TaxID=327575 RepID=UPI00288C02F2|nr:YtxH domain-containing protein [Capnocytophaga leadbetteri]